MKCSVVSPKESKTIKHNHFRANVECISESMQSVLCSELIRFSAIKLVCRLCDAVHFSSGHTDAVNFDSS